MALIIDPALWKWLPHGDQSAWLDFLGIHELLHKEYATAIRGFGGQPYPALPLAPAPRLVLTGRLDFYPDDLWHQAHQLVSAGEASSLLIAAPPDLRAYDLRDAEQLASWSLLHANEMTRVRQAIGI